jgi:tetratricopeptide (TPR) repeat protein
MVQRLTVGLVLVASVALSVAQTPPPPPTGEAPLTVDQALEVARAKFKAGQVGEALDFVKRLLVQSPKNVEANLLAAEILVAQPDLDLARSYFMRVLENEPSNYRANLGLGKIWVESRYWRQAASYLEKAESVAPSDGKCETKRLLAIALAQTGEFERGVEKAEDAVRSGPDSLEALRTLVEIRQIGFERDAGQVDKGLKDVEAYVRKATEQVERSPWERERLNTLGSAIQLQLDVLNALHQRYYQKVGKQATDRLLPNKGAEAAAALNRIAECRRQVGLLGLIVSEHENLMLLMRAVQDSYDARNVKYLEHLAATCLQIEDLSARAFGEVVLKDAGMRNQAAEAYRKILEIDPQNEPAQKFLAANPTPAADGAGTAADASATAKR